MGVSLPHAHAHRVCHGCPLWPQLFNYVIDDSLCSIINGSTDSCVVELRLGNKLSDYEYADDITILAVYQILRCLQVGATPFGVQFASYKRKCLCTICIAY